MSDTALNMRGHVHGTKDARRVAKDRRVPAIGLDPGKNACPKYSAAAVPNPMKS